MSAGEEERTEALIGRALRTEGGSPASSSATAAICVTRNLPTGPAGTLGRSQNTTPPSPLPSTTESRKRALRASRSSLAMTSPPAVYGRRPAPRRAGASQCACRSTSSNSATSWPAAAATCAATAWRCAARPRPERPWPLVETRR